MLDAKTVVVVVNGFHALALYNTGTAPEPQLEPLWELSDEAGHTLRPRYRRAGRVYQSMSNRRSAYEAKQYRAAQKRLFLEQVMERLVTLAADNEYSSIVLMASPGALGILRSSMPNPVAQRIKRMIAKDYCNCGARNLNEMLVEVLQ